MSGPGPTRLRESFDLQARACAGMGSPLYGRLLEAFLADALAGGPAARLIEDWTGDALTGFLPLKLLGAVHHDVLAGEAPELAAHYPSVGGTPGPEVEACFLAHLDAQRERLRPRLDAEIQTNEIRRTAAFLPAYLLLARRQGLPLRLLEIGASAGLNLLWDRFGYTLGGDRWGDPASPVQIESNWNGPRGPFDQGATLASARGCDPFPVDLTDPEQVRRLQCFLWADQVERFERQRGALELARQHPPQVEHEPAGTWLPRQLAQSAQSVTTVVVHSLMWDYLGAEEQQGLERAFEEAGARATPEAPLARLSLEFGEALNELRITLWPGGETHLLAITDGHANTLHWQGVELT